MKINSYVTLFLGLLAFGSGIYSIFDGEIAGIAASGYSKIITREDSPMYFWSSVAFILFIGILFIKSSFEEKDSNYKNPFDKEIK